MDKQRIQALLSGVAMGDENATAELAGALAGEQSPGQVELQQVISKQRFRAKLQLLSQEYPVLDKERDPEGYREAEKLDLAIAKKHPEMDEYARLHLVAERVTKKLKDPEERDNKKAIEIMRDSRNPQLATGIEFNDDDSDLIGDVDDRDSPERSDVIQEMIAQRRQQQEASGIRSREPAELPKPRRAAPFPR